MLDGTGVLRTFLHAYLGTTDSKEDHFATNSYYACIYILHFILHACVKLYTHVHVWSDAMRIFCICTRVSHACDTRGLFKLWVICTVDKWNVYN